MHIEPTQLETTGTAQHTDGSDLAVNIITVCGEPGSGITMIAREVADRMGFAYYDREILTRIAIRLNVDESIPEEIERQRLRGVQDFISSLFNERYLWSGLYLSHLKTVVERIAEKEKAVIVGRGANFILPPASRFAVRVIAPLPLRIHSVAAWFNTTEKEARKRVLTRQNRREAFIKDSFQEDLTDPANYDLLINSARVPRETAADIIIRAAGRFTPSLPESAAA